MVPAAGDRWPLGRFGGALVPDPGGSALLLLDGAGRNGTMLGDAWRFETEDGLASGSYRWAKLGEASRRGAEWRWDYK
jgi:hypothetical protein